ncbi:MAG: LptF/LptG family permease [Bacteroidales bacterium]|jgi:lipopolysaccharide export system permease protein|nr:LptF/LptG family permease [Bacteroidales bacterium]
MKKLDLYIIKKFLGTFFAAIVLIILIVIVFDISEKIGTFIDNEVPLKAIIFDYYCNFIPYFINVFSALFLFIAVIFFTSRMAQNTEFVAILSSGTSYYRIIAPYVVCALFIGCINLSLANFVIPNVNKTRVAFERTYLKKKIAYADRDFHLQYDSTTFYYLESFDVRSHVGAKFSRETIKNNTLLEKITASSIRFDSAGNTWVLSDYVKRELVDGGEKIETTPIAKIDFPVRPEDFMQDYISMDEMNFKELNTFIRQEKLRGSNRVKFFEYERNNRMTAPFASAILALIGLSLSSNKTRGGIGKNLSIGIALAFVFILFLQFSKVFATVGGFPVWLAAWTPVITYGLIAAFLVKRAPK